MGRHTARSLVVILVPCVFVVVRPAHGARQPEAPAVVLFDRGHGQRFLLDSEGPLQLSQLAGRLRGAGLALRPHRSKLATGSFGGVRALIISGPFIQLTPEEVQAVTGFVRAGGRVAVMLHVATPAAELLHGLGVSISNGVIRDPARAIGGEEHDFSTSSVRSHPVTKGVRGFALHGAWALLPRGRHTRAIASSSARSWVDLDRDGKLSKADAVQAFAVAVAGSLGRGQFVVFGDDAVFQNRFLRGGNLRLADNLARWLAGR